VPANLDETSRIVLQKFASANRIIGGMPDVVYHKAIAVTPAVPVVGGERNAVAVPERLVCDQIT
jgi:hypothetical protein